MRLQQLLAPSALLAATAVSARRSLSHVGRPDSPPAARGLSDAADLAYMNRFAERATAQPLFSEP